MHQGGN